MKLKRTNRFESKYSKEIHTFLKNALDEDIGYEDHTSKSYFKNNNNNSFKLITKSNCVISGIRLSEIFIILSIDLIISLRTSSYILSVFKISFKIFFEFSNSTFFILCSSPSFLNSLISL